MFEDFAAGLVVELCGFHTHGEVSIIAAEVDDAGFDGGGEVALGVGADESPDSDELGGVFGDAEFVGGDVEDPFDLAPALACADFAEQACGFEFFEVVVEPVGRSAHEDGEFGDGHGASTAEEFDNPQSDRGADGLEVCGRLDVEDGIALAEW